MKYILGGFLILFSSFADIFLFRIHIVPFTPSSFLLPLFIVFFLINYSIKDYLDIFRSHSFKVLFFILAFSIIYAGFSEASSTIIIEKIVLNTITLLLYTFAVHYFRTEDRKTVTIVMSLALLVLAGSIFYDFFIGFNYNARLAQSSRKGGFGENPNQAASAVKFLSLAVLLLVNETKKIRYAVVVIMVITVFLTLSRSGIVSVVLILVFGTTNNWSSRFELSGKAIFTSFFKITILFSILYIGLLSFSEIMKKTNPAFTRGAAGKRLDALLGQSKQSSNSNSGGTLSNTSGRGTLLFDYWEDFQDWPLGYGTGYTSDKNFNKLNTHNYFLYLALNLGIIMFLAYIFYIFYSIKLAVQYDQFYYLIFMVLIIFEGFISHSIWYERPLVVCLALFDSHIYRKNLNELD